MKGKLTHFHLSMFKSCLRIVACIALFAKMFEISAGIFLVAEIVGIMEETV
jgi:hypothetical protein